MGGCLGANRSIKSSPTGEKEIYHANMHTGRHNSLWEHYVDHQGVINTDSNLNETLRTWESVKLYETEQSKLTIHKQAMNEMNWESAGGPSAQYLKTNSGTISQPCREVSVSHPTKEVQATFDINSPVVDEARVGEPTVMFSLIHCFEPFFLTLDSPTHVFPPESKSFTSPPVNDEFDEPAAKNSGAASSSFDNYLSERKVDNYEEDTQVYVATRSGRWATLADAGAGCDGFKKMMMVKPLTGGKPEMRSHSSFEIRNLSSFRTQFV